MRALLDFTKQTLDDVGDGEAFPVMTGKALESETGFPISIQAVDGGWIDGNVFLDASLTDRQEVRLEIAFWVETVGSLF